MEQEVTDDDIRRFPGDPGDAADRLPAITAIRKTPGESLEVPDGIRGSAAAARAWLRGLADQEGSRTVEDMLRWIAAGDPAAVLAAIAELGESSPPHRPPLRPISDEAWRRINKLVDAGRAQGSALLALRLLLLLADAPRPASPALWTVGGRERRTTCGSFGDLRIHLSERPSRHGWVLDEVSLFVSGTELVRSARPMAGRRRERVLEFGETFRDAATAFDDAFAGDPEAVRRLCREVSEQIRETAINAPRRDWINIGDTGPVLTEAVAAFVTTRDASISLWEAAQRPVAEGLPHVARLPSDATEWQHLITSLLPEATIASETRWMRGRPMPVVLLSLAERVIAVSARGSVQSAALVPEGIPEITRGLIDPPLDRDEQVVVRNLPYDAERLACVHLRMRAYRDDLEPGRTLDVGHIAELYDLVDEGARMVGQQTSDMGWLGPGRHDGWPVVTFDGDRAEDKLRRAIREGSVQPGTLAEAAAFELVERSHRWRALQSLADEGLISGTPPAVVVPDALEIVVGQERVALAIMGAMAKGELRARSLLDDAALSAYEPGDAAPGTRLYLRRVLRAHGILDEHDRVTAAARNRAWLAVRDAGRDWDGGRRQLRSS